MRLAVDTNVLLRAILRDDPEQSTQAEALLKAANPIVIPLPVLCELAWTLRSAYRFQRSEIHAAIAELTKSSRVEVDRPAVALGLTYLSKGGDFSDGCIVELARSQRCLLASFDHGLLRLAGRNGIHPAQVA